MRVPALLAALVLFGCDGAHEFKGNVVAQSTDAAEIVGRNWDGAPFRLSDLRGKVVIVFFGFTSCPDVCPFTLYRMKTLQEKLGSRAGDVAVVFVSVDPERDSFEKLGAYVPGFNRAFFGLRLTEEELAAATAGYGVEVKKHAPKKPGGYYAVDHSGTLFVIDTAGKLRLKFPHDAKVDALLPDILHLLSSEPTAAAKSLEVLDPFAPPPPGGTAIGAVFMKIVNRSAKTERLISASCDFAEEVELHETLVEGDRVRMVHREEGYTIPAGGSFALEFGGSHIMLMGLKKRLMEGDRFKLTLQFEVAGTVEITVPVRGI